MKKTVERVTSTGQSCFVEIDVEEFDPSKPQVACTEEFGTAKLSGLKPDSPNPYHVEKPTDDGKLTPENVMKGKLIIEVDINGQVSGPLFPDRR